MSPTTRSSRRAFANTGRCEMRYRLERDELSFNRLSIPFVPAEAGTQGRELGQRTGSPLPRGRTEEATNSAHLALILKQQRRLNEPACQRRSKGEARLLAILLNTRGA